MNRAERRRLKRKLDALDAKASATLETFVHERRHGRGLFLAELLSPDQALAHPIFGAGTKEALLGAYGSAHGIGSGLLSECWGCCKRWGPDWPPVAVLTVTTEADKGGVGLLCAACASLDGPGAERLVMRGLERDFGLTDTRKVPAAAFSPEAGRA
jgi:hypothetical protein